MNIDFNNIANPAAAPIAPTAPQAAPAAPSAPAVASDLTITQARPTPEDLTVSTLPADALSRTDDLGLLVSSAFTLPAPPMPAFPAD